MAGGEQNYTYLIDLAAKLATGPAARILDFGCGQGPLIVRGRERGLDIVGTDVWAGGFQVWASRLHEAARDRIKPMEDGKIPFCDATFDVVIANQVFEHVANPPGPLAEIRRVLKPGGAFVAAFPSDEVWFEGHVGLYFPHFLRARPELQGKYLQLMRRAGFGYYGEGLSPQAWAAHMQQVMREEVWYHPWRDVARWWRDAFGSEPESLASEYMAYRAAQVPRLGAIAHWLDTPGLRPFSRFICHRRAGRVLLVRAPG